ncbi:MAG: GNAT family N-acetyltransferase [Desulfovibrio sp.]
MTFKQYNQDILPELHTTWEKLAISSSQADPFCCAPTWQMTFHKAFAPERRLWVKSSSNSLVAFAEHIDPSGEIILTPIESHWFFGCPILGKDGVKLFAENISEIERLYPHAFPKILISGVRPGGVLSRRLIKALARNFNLYLFSSGIQAAASLKDGMDGYLSRRSRNHRKKLRKQVRQTTEMEVSYERVAPTSTEEAEAIYSRIITVERKSWKGIEKCGMAEPGAKEFYDFMIKRLAMSKNSRVIFAQHEGEDIGFIFGGLAGKIYRGQQFSFNENWREYSIGNLLQFEKIKWLCEEGIKRYDMGPITGPKMGYKKHWTEKQAEIQTWLLIRR